MFSFHHLHGFDCIVIQILIPLVVGVDMATSRIAMKNEMTAAQDVWSYSSPLCHYEGNVSPVIETVVIGFLLLVFLLLLRRVIQVLSITVNFTQGELSRVLISYFSLCLIFYTHQFKVPTKMYPRSIQSNQILLTALCITESSRTLGAFGSLHSELWPSLILTSYCTVVLIVDCHDAFEVFKVVKVKEREKQPMISKQATRKKTLGKEEAVQRTNMVMSDLATDQESEVVEAVSVSPKVLMKKAQRTFRKASRNRDDASQHPSVKFVEAQAIGKKLLKNLNYTTDNADRYCMILLTAHKLFFKVNSMKVSDSLKGREATFSSILTSMGKAYSHRRRAGLLAFQYTHTFNALEDFRDDDSHAAVMDIIQRTGFRDRAAEVQSKTGLSTILKHYEGEE
jgi:hypothetical protein